MGTEDIVCFSLEAGAFSVSSYQLLNENILLVTLKAMLTLYWIAVGMVFVTQQNCAMPTVSGAPHIR